jgi:hypothetical protein
MMSAELAGSGTIVLDPQTAPISADYPESKACESIAEPGGISLSEDAWRQVQGKVAANFARSAVGMAGLPSNSAVEVEMIVEIE